MNLRRPYILFFFACTLSLTAQQAPLTLEAALHRSRQVNDRLRASDLRSEAAESRMIRARAAFLPSITLNGLYTRRPFETKRVVGGDEIVIQSLNALSATANASMPLINLPVFARHGQAAHERDAALQDQSSASMSLLYSTAEAFLTALAARQVREAADHRLTFAQENLDAAQARFSARIVGSNDVTRATLEQASAEYARIQAGNAEHTALLQLGLLLQSTAPDSLVIPTALLERAVNEPTEIPALITEALDRRPDLGAARARLSAMQASATEALLRALPSLDLTGQYRITNEAGLSGKNTNWFIGATLNWNILDGGLWFGDRQERSALVRAQELELRALERQATTYVHTAVLRLVNARAAVRQANVALEAATRNATETAERYRQGLASALESADAGLRLFDAESVMTQQRASLIMAWFDLHQAIGRYPLEEGPTP